MVPLQKWARFTGRRTPGHDVPPPPDELLVIGSEIRMAPPVVQGSQVGPGPSTAFSVSKKIDPPVAGFNGGDIIAWFPRDQVSDTLAAVVAVDKTYFFQPGIYRYHFCMQTVGATDFALGFTFSPAGPGNPVTFPWGPSGYTVMLRRPSAAYRTEVWGKVFLPAPFGVILTPLQAILDADIVQFDATIENDMLLDEAGVVGGGL